MKFSYPWIKEFVKLDLSAREFANALNETAFDTELTDDPNVLEVKLPPNRVCDASGHLGLAKEASRIAKSPMRHPDESFKVSATRASDKVHVRILDKDLCRRYTAAYAENVKVKQSPLWMQKHLAECGVRPINAVVDITNYVMLEYGQPLHAFDADKLAKDKAGKAVIIVRRSKQGESITTLEDKSYELAGSELLICDAAGALAVAGIKGGRKAEIDEHTTRIVVESANFDPVSVRKTSRSLGIRTDASVRFENDMDPNLTESAIRRVCNLIESICGGSVAKGFVDAYPKKTKPVKLSVSLVQASKLIGISVSAKTAEAAFALFCDSVKKQAGEKYVLTVNTMRRDIVLAEDAIEEIARYIGYDAIGSQTVSEPVQPAVLDERMQAKWLFQDVLVRLGFDETMNYSLIEDKDQEAFDCTKESFIKVTKSVSGKYSFLRPGLLAGMLKNVRDNAHAYPQLKLFEIGRVYAKRERKDDSSSPIVPEEVTRLGMMLYGVKYPVDADQKKMKEDPRKQFLDLKGYVESMFGTIGIPESALSFERMRKPEGGKPWPYEPFEAARIMVFGEQVGIIANIAFWLRANNYGIDLPVSFGEIDMDAVYALRQKKYYEPLPRFPDALRDISVFVNPDSTVAEVQAIIANAASKNLHKIEFLGLYENESAQGGAGRKSMTFHLSFRSSEHTLTEDEINEDMATITDALLADKKAAAKIR